MSITDEIYRELWEGVEKGADWQQILAKHNTSKGPLYSAVGRFFNEVGTKIGALNEQRSRVQSELDQAGLTLDVSNKKIKEAESNIAPLDHRKSTLTEEVETLETKLAEKSELVKHLAELEKLGFNIERLKQLQNVLKEIGTRHGLTGKEAVSKFFGDLKEYETVVDAELELKRLQTLMETKKLEAENWQAKEEALRRKHDDLNEAIKATQALCAKGIKESQITAWDKVLSRVQSVEQFAQSLAQYSDMIGLLKAKKEENKNYELRTAKAQSQLETLEKEMAKIEGAIDALKVSWMKEPKVMTEQVTKELKKVADMEVSAIRTVGQEFRLEFTDFLTRLQNSGQKIFEMGQEYERMNQKLQKYQGVKDALESHLDASEGEK